MILHVVDSFAAARTEFNSVFGNSATVGIRFAGLGNLSFAQLAAAAIALSGLLAWRVRGTRGARIAIAILAVSLLALAPPIWGQNFGATLAAAPAFALLGWLLLGRPVRRGVVLALGGLLLGIGVVAGLLDLLRPSGQRSHVGRFFESFGNGSGGFVTVLQRKASEAFDSLSAYHWIVLIVAVGLAASRRNRPDPNPDAGCNRPRRRGRARGRPERFRDHHLGNDARDRGSRRRVPQRCLPGRDEGCDDATYNRPRIRVSVFTGR